MTTLGNKPFTLFYQRSVIKKDIAKLSPSIQKQIKHAIVQRLGVDPVSFGKPLRYSLKGHRRLRVGDYRVVYRIEEKKREVIVVAIKHRKDIYNIYT